MVIKIKNLTNIFLNICLKLLIFLYIKIYKIKNIIFTAAACLIHF